VHVGSIDCTADDSKKLCFEFGIQGYPTLAYCPPDESCKRYDGARTVEGFTNFYKEDYKLSKAVFKIPKLNLVEVKGITPMSILSSAA
jgi:hypothetical protein